eukprot:1156964-Pelagomonas_calceolata.AAC.10
MTRRECPSCLIRWVHDQMGVAMLLDQMGALKGCIMERMLQMLLSSSQDFVLLANEELQRGPIVALPRFASRSMAGNS